MIDWLIVIILSEIILFLGIKIVYWADYTHSYIHCHCNTAPCEICWEIEEENRHLKAFINELTSRDGRIWLSSEIYDVKKVLKGDDGND